MNVFRNIRMLLKTRALLGAFGPDPEKACRDGLSREDEIRAALANWEKERVVRLPCRLELILREMAQSGLYASERRSIESFCLPADGAAAPVLPWRHGNAFSTLPPALRAMVKEYENDAKKLAASAEAARYWSAALGKKRRMRERRD